MITLAKSALWAVVVAQLVEQSLPVLEVFGSYAVIGKLYIEQLLSTAFKKTNIKKKRPAMAYFR